MEYSNYLWHYKCSSYMIPNMYSKFQFPSLIIMCPSTIYHHHWLKRKLRVPAMGDIKVMCHLWPHDNFWHLIPRQHSGFVRCVFRNTSSVILGSWPKAFVDEISHPWLHTSFWHLIPNLCAKFQNLCMIKIVKKPLSLMAFFEDVECSFQKTWRLVSSLMLWITLGDPFKYSDNF